MALKGGFRFPVRFGDVFPSGVVMGADSEPVVKVTDFEKKGKGKTDDQARDKQNPDLREWAVRVHDLDSELEGKSREIVIKMSAEVQPVPPVGAFQQVEFENLTVTPWLEEKMMGGDKKSVMRYSFRATGFKDPRNAAGSSSTASISSNGSAAPSKAAKTAA